MEHKRLIFLWLTASAKHIWPLDWKVVQQYCFSPCSLDVVKCSTPLWWHHIRRETRYARQTTAGAASQAPVQCSLSATSTHPLGNLRARSGKPLRQCVRCQAYQTEAPNGAWWRRRRAEENIPGEASPDHGSPHESTRCPWSLVLMPLQVANLFGSAFFDLALKVA